MAIDSDLIEALSSVRQLVTRDARDWSAERHDAFLYGVFVGWQQRRAELAARHQWDDEFVARLDRLHDAVRRALLHQGEAA